MRKVALDGYAHQDVPFEMLLQALQPQRDLSRTPLFQVFINMLELPNQEIGLPGLKASPLRSLDIGAKFDLTLYISERREGLVFNLVYNADLFDSERMKEMLDQYEHLLRQVAANPEESIARFSLMTESSKEILPNPIDPLGKEWYGAIHTRVSEQARRIPNVPRVRPSRQLRNRP